MEELNNEVLNDIKKEEQSNEQDYMNEMENFDLNCLFTFGINFDMLKLIINNLIKSNHRINYKLSELKLDKINSEQKFDELELAILDLQIANEQSYTAKTLLQDKKSKISSKNYQNDKDAILKEKEFYSNSLKNLNKNESYKIDKIINNITKFNLGMGAMSSIDNKKQNEELTKKMEEYNNKLKQENKEYKEQIENFKNKINNDINIKFEQLTKKIDETKSSLTNNAEEFNLIKQNIKNIEEKFENKFTNELPEYISNIIKEKSSSIDSKIVQLEEDNEKNLKKMGDNLRESINNLQKNFIEKSNDTENKIFKMRSTENSLAEKLKYLNEEKLKEYTPLKTYKQFQAQLEEKMLSDKNEYMAEIDGVNSNLSSLKNQINEFISDKTDHNNLVMLLKKYESIQGVIYRAQAMMDDYEKEKKRFQNLDPKKVVNSDVFDEFKLNINKTIVNFHKEFQDMKTELIEKNNKYLGTQATLKDLKNLEDDLILKMDELYNTINTRFAEKNLLLKNNKVMELKMKHFIDDYRKTEKNDSWLLSKMPLGHLCASCEAYLGDIKDTNITKYIPWNKYPTKDAADKLYRVGAGYSRMLQMISPDNKYKNKNTSTSNAAEGLSPIGIGKLQEREDDANENLKNKNLNNSAISGSLNIEPYYNQKSNMENKMNQTKFQLPNLLRVKHLKKNSTFSNFYSENLDEQSLKNINNLNFSYLGFNPKNNERSINKYKNEDTDKDEVIHLPNTAARKDVQEEDKKGPKIMKVIKKK